MAELVADFQLGLGLQDATTADFFLDVDALRAGISLTASAVTDVGLNLGFLGLEANGTLDLDAGLTVNTAALQNVTDPSSINVGSLGPDADRIERHGLRRISISILTLTVDAGTSDIGFVASGTLTATGNPFDGSSITLTHRYQLRHQFPRLQQPQFRRRGLAAGPGGWLARRPARGRVDLVHQYSLRRGWSRQDS